MIRKSLLFAALVLTGCGQMDKEEEFRSVLPSKEMVEVKAPGTAGQGLEGEVQAQGGQGQTSDMYLLTRGATVIVNGGTLAVLGLIDAVTKHTPTTVTDDSATWGPHTDALSPTTWKLTVTKTGDTTYSYTLEAKAKTAPDSAFLAIITGHHTATQNEAGEPMRGFGSGDFTLDWDAAQQLPEHDNNIGRMTVRYSRPSASAQVSVEADFRQVRDDGSTQRVDANYRYRATPGAGGEFDFALNKDMYAPSTPSANERLTIKSRWQQTGAGRSDVKMSGGDLAGEATTNECWDANFASRYLRISFEANPRYGTEASDCAFTSAVYSSL
jgi:hypothetical protein